MPASYATRTEVRAYYVLAFVGLMSWAEKAAAKESPITLAYDAPWECPDRDQFWRQLRARSTRLAKLTPEELGITIDARISGSYSLYRGHLTLLESDKSVVERDVGGPNCVDVIAALALITAVTLDAAPAHARTDYSVTERQKKPGKRFAVGAVGGTDKAVAPNVVPTVGLSLTYHDRTLFGSPEFRLEGLFAESKWQRVPGVLAGADARFLWFATRAAACPLQAQVATITVGPCAILELGALVGEGRTAGGTTSKPGLWLAPGALLNWSWQTEPIWLRLAAGGVVPVFPNTFRFNPKPEVFRPHGLGVTAEVELAWAFK
jgi:hypothetical protein